MAMIGIVRLALSQPYTFVVMALLILIFGAMAAIRTSSWLEITEPAQDLTPAHASPRRWLKNPFQAGPDSRLACYRDVVVSVE